MAIFKQRPPPAAPVLGQASSYPTVSGTNPPAPPVVQSPTQMPNIPAAGAVPRTPWTNYGGQGNPNAPTSTEQAGLTNAANNRAGSPNPSIAVTNNRGTGVPIMNYGHPNPDVGAGGPVGASGGPGGRWDESWFRSNIGAPNTPGELLALEAKIVAAGGKVLRNAAGTAGKIQTPDGRTIDVVLAAGAGGRGFWWGEGGGGAGGGAGGGGGAAFPTDNIFNDPATKALEEMFRTRLGELQKPIDDPNRDALLKLLTGFRDAAPGQDAQALTGFGRKRFDELQGDSFTGTEEKALRVERFDRMEQDRQAEKRREVDRLMAQGHAPTSGTVVEVQRRIDEKYNQLRASGENQLLTYTIGERQNRQREAMDIGSFLEQQARGQTVDRIGYGTAASGLESGVRGEEEGRRREALATAALPSELTQQRLQLALQALGLGTGQSASVMNSLLGLGNQGLQQQQLNNAGWSGFGQLLTQLAGLYRPQVQQLQQPAA